VQILQPEVHARRNKKKEAKPTPITAVAMSDADRQAADALKNWSGPPPSSETAGEPLD